MSKKLQTAGSAGGQERRFNVISIVFLSVIAFFQLFPFWLKLVDATHSPDFYPELGKVYIWFADFTLVNFKTVIQSAGCSRRSASAFCTPFRSRRSACSWL